MEAHASAPATRPLRVVVVDDHDDVRLLLRVEFELDGRFEVVGEGADGDQAIELAGRLQPDLLVLDRNMPGRGGLEAIEPVRNVAPGTAIVLYTAAADAAAHHAALAAGALDVLDKTAGPQFVDRLTAKLLDQAGAEGESVEMRVGPVPTAAARAWIANTQRILDAIARRPDVVQAPEDVIDLFQSLLEQWQAVASTAEEFLWIARADIEAVSRVVEHWAVIDAMTDEQLEELGVHWSPPEGQPFFDALTAGVLRALERHQGTRRLAEQLDAQWTAYREAEAATARNGPRSTTSD